MSRVLHHVAGVVFLLWVVFVAAKWAFVGGLAAFGIYAWETRPGAEERERRAEQARQERPVTPQERVGEAVNGSSAVKLRLIERRWLVAAVEARNPTGQTVGLEGVRCRVLFSPGGGQPRDISNRGSWRIRLEPGASHRGEVAFHKSDVSAVVAPVALAEYRCVLRVRVVPPPTAPPGAPSNPVRTAPGGYRGMSLGEAGPGGGERSGRSAGRLRVRTGERRLWWTATPTGRRRPGGGGWPTRRFDPGRGEPWVLRRGHRPAPVAAPARRTTPHSVRREGRQTPEAHQGGGRRPRPVGTEDGARG